MCSGGGGGGTSTVTQNADPWSGVQPYLLGSSSTRLKAGVKPIYKQEQTWNPNGPDGGVWETKNVIANPSSDYETVKQPGVYPEAQSLYKDGSWSPEMQSLTDAQSSAIGGRTPGQVAQANQLGNSLYSGQYDPNVQRVGDTTAQMVDPSQAFGSMGAANPTNSVSKLLSGQVDTSTLDPVVNNAMRRLGENFNEQVMPAINQGAVAAGQYGGSRQGIAQGLAAKGLAYSMGDTANSLYNQAYQQAQQNMYGTANNMANLGLTNAQNNANRDFLSQSKNADIALQNNAQAMQGAQQQVANRLQGLNAIQGGNALNDQAYSQQMGLLNAPNDYKWQNLNKYASIVQPGAGMGSSTSSTSTQSGGSNPLAGAVGGAMTGGALFGASGPLAGALGITGPWGAAIGAGLGLLGGLK